MRYVLISYSNLVKYGEEDEEKKNGETCRISLIYVSRCDVMLRNTLWTMHEIGTFGHYVRLTTVSISILELELRWASVQLQICAKAIIAKQMNRKLSSEDYYNNFNLTGCKCRESIAHTVEVKTQCRNIQNGSEEGHRKWWHNVTANMLRI